MSAKSKYKYKYENEIITNRVQRNIKKKCKKYKIITKQNNQLKPV